jgi:hypothetical protein
MKLWERHRRFKRKFPTVVPVVKYKELQSFLEDQSTYTLHKPAIRKFKFRKTMASYVNQQWQADLGDMQKFAKKNNG